MLQLFDTAQGRVVPFEPREPGKVSMYVCGPTVYGPPHVGHGRFSLVFDVLRRYFEWSGLEVTYVSNITDIDDKIIERAQTEGREPAQIAEKCEKVWYRAMDAINVKRPTHDPHATDYVDRMIELIGTLVAQGDAYETSDGVYFSPAKVDDYGLLARQSIDSLQAGARVEANDEKRSPIDFALWKKAKPGEPSWPSPWGEGRPGWHTECVVMALDLLGEGFDIHGGGQDLAFPHHENERAQAVASGKQFAAHWVHNGFVEVSGEKMSKSLDNFTNLLDLIRSTDPRAYRLLVLRAHYRKPIEVNPVNTAEAAESLSRLDEFSRRASELPAVAADEATLAEFRRLMDDDLNTPGAMSLLFTAVRQANKALAIDDDETAGSLYAAVSEICQAVGLELEGLDLRPIPDDMLARAAERDRARDSRDWGRADELRQELQERGYIVEDTPTGTTLRRRP